MCDETSGQDTVYQVDSINEDSLETLFTTVKQNLSTILELEELSGVAPRHVTSSHISEALDIADYYRNFNYQHVGQKVFNQQNIFLGPKTSLFEFLLDLFAAIQTSATINIHVHATRKPTALVICKEMVCVDKE